jgi:hypothetical protein
MPSLTPTPPPFAIALAAGALMSLAGGALGQESPGPSAPPAQAEPGEPGEPGDSIQPQPQPAELPEAIRRLLLGASEPGDSGTGTLAVEGAVLPERPGLIRRTPYGEWAFVFMGDDGQPGAIVLLPCRQLERMVESIQAIDAPAVRLTGTLTVYDRVNYLLPTNYAVIAAPVDGEGQAESQTEGQDGGQDGAEGQDASPVDPLSRIDPQLREVAEAMEAGRQRARSLQAPSVAPPGGEGPASGADGQDESVEHDAMQEGDRLVRRRARLVRERGLWALRFDQGADAPADKAPLLVLPNSALRAMEQAVNRYGDQVAFEVSGTIYRYGRQPYALITMQFIQPLEGLRPRG